MLELFVEYTNPLERPALISVYAHSQDNKEAALKAFNDCKYAPIYEINDDDDGELYTRLDTHSCCQNTALMTHCFAVTHPFFIKSTTRIIEGVALPHEGLIKLQKDDLDDSHDLITFFISMNNFEAAPRYVSTSQFKWRFDDRFCGLRFNTERNNQRLEVSFIERTHEFDANLSDKLSKTAKEARACTSIKDQLLYAEYRRTKLLNDVRLRSSAFRKLIQKKT